MTEPEGLYPKYEVRKDGTPVEGRVFVLKPDSDPDALLALLHYAHAVGGALERDLSEEYKLIPEPLQCPKGHGKCWWDAEEPGWYCADCHAWRDDPGGPLVRTEMGWHPDPRARARKDTGS